MLHAHDGASRTNADAARGIELGELQATIRSPIASEVFRLVAKQFGKRASVVLPQKVAIAIATKIVSIYLQRVADQKVEVFEPTY
jgi:hypothetical protein